MNNVDELKSLLEKKTKEYEEASSRFELLFHYSPFSMQILNHEGLTIKVNSAWKKLWDVSDEYVEQHVHNIYNVFQDPSVIAKGLIPYFERALRGETVQLPKTEYDPKETGKPGRLRITRPLICPLKDQSGKIRELMLIHEDITEEHGAVEDKQFLAKIAAMLLQSIEYLTTLDHIATAVIPYFADGCIVDLIEDGEIKRLVTKHVDPKLERIMKELLDKYPPTFDSPQPTPRTLRSGKPELLMKVCTDVIAKHCYNEEHGSMIKSTGLKSHIAVPLILRGETIGSLNFWITTSRQLFNEKDLQMALSIGHYAALAIENARLYRDSQQAISQREDFISIASHELKTPVTALVLQMEIIQAMLKDIDSFDRENAIKIAESSTRQLDRLSGLIEDMLDLTRMSRKKMIAETMNTVDLKELVGQTLNRFSDQLSSKGITLLLNPLENISIKCDPPRLEQVIANVITNAIIYGENKPISVAMESNKERVLIRIKDQGIGIAPKFHERIFQRFERVHSATDGKGLGLGLFICKQIMQEHNGMIYVQSELGKGSEFIIVLPLK